MKNLMRVIIEQQITEMEQHLNVGMDILNELVAALESLIEVPEASKAPKKTKQELLEEELEELLMEHCKAVCFHTEGNMTIAAVMTDDGDIVPKVGVAKCSPDDEFNEIAGEIVAVRRALGLHVDVKKYGEPKIEKDCFNCKHQDLGMFDQPCAGCLEVEEPTGWEPVEKKEVVLGDCDTCKFDDRSVFQSPCNECLESKSGLPICWTPAPGVM